MQMCLSFYYYLLLPGGHICSVARKRKEKLLFIVFHNTLGILLVSNTPSYLCNERYRENKGL